MDGKPSKMINLVDNKAYFYHGDIKQCLLNGGANMDFIQEILKIIRSNLPDHEIKEKLLEYHDSDIADVLDYLDVEERYRVAKILGVEEVSDVLTYMDEADELLDQISDEKVADIIENLDADDAVDLLQEMEEDEQEKILELIEDEEVKEDIELILSFDESEVGSLMTTNFVTISENDSVTVAMRKLIDQASENDNISTIFVTKENGEFIGALPLNDLIILRKSDDIKEKIMYNYPSIQGKAKIDEVINSIKEYYEDIIPILDEENILIGVLTANDLVELIEDEATEDYHRLAGLTEEEEVDESIFQSIKKRIPWLALLLVLGLLVTSVISAFENVINAVTGAVIFQSLVFGMAGNGGTQALAVTLTSINSEYLYFKLYKNGTKIANTQFIRNIVDMSNLIPQQKFEYAFSKTENKLGVYIIEESAKNNINAASELLINQKYNVPSSGYNIYTNSGENINNEIKDNVKIPMLCVTISTLGETATLTINDKWEEDE